MAATRTPEEYLDLPYAIALTRGDGDGDEAWTATVDELPGCQARGRTPEEAAARVQAAMEEWVADALAGGRPVPEPRSALSGRLLVRMPRTLHADLARAASREGVSLNQFISGALSAAVAWRADPAAPPGEPGAAAPEGDEAQPAPAAPPRDRRLQRLLMLDLVLVAVGVAVAIVLLATA
jgi:antitoxin HicB